MSLKYGSLALFVLSLAGAARAGAPYQHVLLLSIDGLHGADLTDPAVAPYIPVVLDLTNRGVRYDNAYAVKPTDNFPNVVAQVTGAGPKTSGIYYDSTYRRNYYRPGAGVGSLPGTSAAWTGDLDKDPTLINGGGNADASSINVNNLPQVKVNGVLQPVFPHDDLKVNTVFEVARAAGLRTAYIDKHPSYEIVNGPSGHGLDDFYAPESDAKARLLNGVLVDASVTGSSKGLKQISKDITLSEAYDDMRVDALVNQIHGKTAAGLPAASPGAPALFGMGFIAVNTAQKDVTDGGIDDFGFGNAANPGMGDALSRTNANVARIVDALKTTGQYDNTLIVLTSKHGQSPRVGSATNAPSELVIGTLGPAGIPVLQTTDDDVSLVWLANAAQAAAARDELLRSQGSLIDHILIGAELKSAGLGDPATDDRAPDMLVLYKEGVLLGNNKRAEHGGFSEDDSHIALVLAGGGIPPELQGTVQFGDVLDTQIAPTMLDALGLDSRQLQGAVIDGTVGLPGSGIPVPEPGAAAAAMLFLTAILSARRGGARALSRV